MSFMADKQELYHWICRHRPWHWKKNREYNFPLWVPKAKRPKVIKSSFRYVYPSIAEDLEAQCHWWQQDHGKMQDDEGDWYYVEYMNCQWHSGGYKNAGGRVKVKPLRPIPPLSKLSIYPPEEVFGVDNLVYKNGEVYHPWSMYTIPKRLHLLGYYVKGHKVYRNDGQVLCSCLLVNSHKRYRPYGLPCINVPEPNGRCSSHGGNVIRGMGHPAHRKAILREMEELGI